MLSRSRFYHSPPWGFDSPNEFVNLAISITTDMTPTQLLYATQRIERDMGRTVKSDGHYEDRVIDIDILLWNATGDASHPEWLSVNTRRLTIPHPLMTRRPFVMAPLSEILPSLWDNGPDEAPTGRNAGK